MSAKGTAVPGGMWRPRKTSSRRPSSGSKTAQAAPATTPVPSGPPSTAPRHWSDLTVAELRRWADEHGWDLEEVGTRKADIVEALERATHRKTVPAEE